LKHQQVATAINPAKFLESKEVHEKVRTICAYSKIHSGDYKILIGYIAAHLIYLNGQRPAAVQNMTITEFEEREQAKNDDDEYCVQVIEHKTAAQGPVVLTFKTDILFLMKQYKKLRKTVKQVKAKNHLFFLT